MNNSSTRMNGYAALFWAISVLAIFVSLLTKFSDFALVSLVVLAMWVSLKKNFPWPAKKNLLLTILCISLIPLYSEYKKAEQTQTQFPGQTNADSGKQIINNAINGVFSAINQQASPPSPAQTTTPTTSSLPDGGPVTELDYNRARAGHFQQNANSAAQRERGVDAYYGRGIKMTAPDYGAALSWFKMSAANGDALSAAWIAHMILQSHGTPYDPLGAKRWLLLAIERGDVSSYITLSDLYLADSAAPLNKEEAFRLAFLGAEAGNIPAQISVGEKYAKGIGTTRNFAKAREWLGRAHTEQASKIMAEINRLEKALAAARRKPEQQNTPSQSGVMTDADRYAARQQRWTTAHDNAAPKMVPPDDKQGDADDKSTATFAPQKPSNRPSRYDCPSGYGYVIGQCIRQSYNR